MDYSFCFYTQSSASFPNAGYELYVNSFIKPLIQSMLDNTKIRVSLSLSDAFINYLSKNAKEINLIFSDFLKANRMELLSNAYNNKMMSSLVPRDRMDAVDKTTTLISKVYSTRAVSSYYGSYWNTNLVNPMSLLGLENLVVSSRDVVSGLIDTTNFRMNKNGKKINIVKTDPLVEKLVFEFSTKEISYESFEEKLKSLILNKNDSTILMINIDQLCKGATLNKCNNPIYIISSLLDALSTRKDSFSLVKDSHVNKRGYLDSSFYSYDIKRGCLASPNQLLVKNESYRYYENRVLALSELLQDLKKLPTSKKNINAILSKIPSNSMYYLDSTASCLRVKELELYYNSILESQRRLADLNIYPKPYDLDDDGLVEYFAVNKTTSAVLASRGAGVFELNSIAMAKNLFAVVSSFDDYKTTRKKDKCFLDKITINDKTYDLEDKIFTLESKIKNKTEFIFTYSCDDFIINKAYKLSNQGIVLNVSLINKCKGKAKINYSLDLTFNANKKLVNDDNSLSADTYILKYSSDLDNISFSSSEPFTSTDNDVWQEMPTCLGLENFYLYTKACMSYDFDLEENEEKTIQIKTKFTTSKEY